MLADELDFVIGVDPHRDSHALGVVEVRSGAVVFESSVHANSAGYAEALRLAEQHSAGRRAFAVEGSGSFGAGLTRFLQGRGERVLELGRLQRERGSGAKTDAARRDPSSAKRAWQEESRIATQQRGTRGATGSDGCSRGRRERKTCSTLPASRDADHHTRASPQRAAPAHARATSRAARRDPPRTQTRRRTTRYPARPPRRRSPRATADRRGARTRRRDQEARPQTRTSAPRPTRSRPSQRCPGDPLVVTPRPPRERGRVRPPRRCRSDPACSGQTTRYRLDRGGDRKLNGALHQILVTRRRAHGPTIA